MAKEGRKTRSIEELYEKAALHAKLSGWEEEAYDFAGWIAIKWLEGKSKHQRISDSFIDYLRAQYGGPRRSRSRYQLSRALRAAAREAASSREHSAEEALDRILASGGHFERSHPEFTAIERERDRLGARYFSARGRSRIYELLREGYNLREIGRLTGLTEARISQIIAQEVIRARTRAQHH